MTGRPGPAGAVPRSHPRGVWPFFVSFLLSPGRVRRTTQRQDPVLEGIAGASGVLRSLCTRCQVAGKLPAKFGKIDRFREVVGGTGFQAPLRIGLGGKGGK